MSAYIIHRAHSHTVTIATAQPNDISMLRTRNAKKTVMSSGILGLQGTIKAGLLRQLFSFLIEFL